ncbi:uncharacterized protein LOC129111945 [Anoplopoma fimbria]|uniref:uncharacterized protein LOC129111945 n=1 Tax=Anoplopoma fimbria TaxID=229290 RepID=UPI0023EDAAD9|nr:uncharacterized protein LOC129111945 [Anoplopoma fimbria]
MLKVVFVLLFLQLSSAAADIPDYKKIGNSVVLKPDSAVNPSAPIKSIRWTHGQDIAADWDGEELSYYRHFEGRSTLNISSGALTITGLSRNDSGRFSAEINNKKPSNSIQLLVISPVSKPHISIWCDPQMDYCLFTCEGNTTGAEPITYSWVIGDYHITSTKVHKFTKEYREHRFACGLENPVSYSFSDSIPNPFPARFEDFSFIFIISELVVIVLVCVLLCILLMFKKGQRVDGKTQENLVMIATDQEPPVV